MQDIYKIAASGGISDAELEQVLQQSSPLSENSATKMML